MDFLFLGVAFVLGVVFSGPVKAAWTKVVDKFRA